MRLLEREPQLAALRDYAADATRGVGRVVLVEGEAGIGKSTLVEALEASLPEATWAWGACESLSTPRPLAPLHDLADQLGGELAELCRAEAGRDRLFEALLDHLRGREQLTALVFEDVHWADDATLDLLRHLARRVQRLRVLLLVTFRDEQLAGGLQVALGDLVRQRTVRRVTLPTLSGEAVRALVAEQGLDADEVHRLTGGNPYFVAELLATGRDGLARTARDAVLARVASLSSDARAALEAAALLGSRVDADVLEQVSGVAPASYDELVAAGLVLVADRSLRFRHEIARMAVADAVPPFRAVEVHRAALATLVERGVGRGVDVSRLAFHAEGAGDGPAVVAYASRAAAEAAALGSHREAVEHYRRALRFSDDEDGSLRRRLAHELGLLDEWEEAEALWREVIGSGAGPVAASGAVAAALELGDATRMHSRALWRLSRGAEARAAAHAAVGILEPLGPSVELARAVAEVAGSEMMHGDIEASRASAEAALALAEELGAADVASDALNVLGCLLVDTGGDWEAPLRRALAIAREAGLSTQAGRCYVNLYSSYVDLVRVAEGERTFHDGLAYIEAQEVPVYGTCLLASRGEALEMLGRWDEVCGLADGLRSTPMSPINRMHLDLAPARVAVRRGAPEAGEVVGRLVELGESTQEPQWVVPMRLLRAEWHWLAGRVEEAERDVMEAAAAAVVSLRLLGRAAVWQQRLGLPVEGAADLGTVGVGSPYDLQLRGEHRAAALAWDDRQMPYEAALARLDSGEPDLLAEALEAFARLGAEPLVQLTRRRLRESGVRPVSTRRSTREHPAGLTEQEQHVLALLCAGCSNADIAARLVISVKTAGHHVSAVLTKLGVANRHEAVAEARRRGFGAEDREPAPAT